MDPYRVYAQDILVSGDIDFEIERVRQMLIRTEKLPLANRKDQTINVQGITRMFRALLSAKEIRDKAIQYVR